MVALDAGVDDRDVGVDLDPACGQRLDSRRARADAADAGLDANGWIRGRPDRPAKAGVTSSSEISSSGMTAATDGSAEIDAYWSAVRRAEKPPSAALYTSSMSFTPLRAATSWTWSATRFASTWRWAMPSELPATALRTG